MGIKKILNVKNISAVFLTLLLTIGIGCNKKSPILPNGEFTQISVVNAQLMADSQTVRLTIEEVKYISTITVCNIKDRYNNAVICPPGQIVVFACCKN